MNKENEKKQLSSEWFFLYREPWIVLVLLIAGIVAFVPNLFVYFAFLPFGIGCIAVCLFLFFTCRSIKDLYIDDWGKHAVVIPILEIKNIADGYRLNPELAIVVIELKKETILGKTISFVPRDSQSGWYKPAPVIRELKTLAKLTD